jgi:hypothetical protein
LKAEDLVGTWRLRSWKNVGSDGSEVHPLGERPVGYIFYNHDGYMSVEIMAEGRMPYQEPDVFGGTPQERSEAISTSGLAMPRSVSSSLTHHLRNRTNGPASSALTAPAMVTEPQDGILEAVRDVWRICRDVATAATRRSALSV